MNSTATLSSTIILPGGAIGLVPTSQKISRFTKCCFDRSNVMLNVNLHDPRFLRELAYDIVLATQHAYKASSLLRMRSISALDIRG